MIRYKLLLVLIIPLIFSSCKKFRRTGLPFGDVKRTHFTEARRIYTNGLKFDKQGYQLEPSWMLFFISDDSVNVYSPKTKRYYGFHVYFDHDSIFNMVDAWFKVKKITADSLILQALRVENKIIKDDDDGSKVFLTFYSDRYIKSQNIDKIKAMALPSKKDTAFVKERSALVNAKPDSVFAAREPVVLKSKSPLIKVEKVKNESTPINEVDAADDYLAPEYNITIHKAYEGFSYIIYVYVDDKGKITFRNSAVPLMSDVKAAYEKVMRGIVDGYLKRYLDVIPGKTLGIPHTTSILLNIDGKVD
jgi:hypothetical protein